MNKLYIVRPCLEIIKKITEGYHQLPSLVQNVKQYKVMFGKEMNFSRGLSQH